MKNKTVLLLSVADFLFFLLHHGDSSLCLGIWNESPILLNNWYFPIYWSETKGIQAENKVPAFLVTRHPLLQTDLLILLAILWKFSIYLRLMFFSVLPEGLFQNLNLVIFRNLVVFSLYLVPAHSQPIHFPPTLSFILSKSYSGQLLFMVSFNRTVSQQPSFWWNYIIPALLPFIILAHSPNTFL